MILVIDFGAGNLASFTKALRFLSLPHRVSSDPAALRGAPLAVLIGVGHFGGVMRRLRERGFDAALRDYARAGSGRLFGICVGMQVLFEASDEAPEGGLGLLPGRLRRLDPQAGAPVPHVGFDDVRSDAPGRLTAGLPEGSAFYFTHSYALMEAPAGSWAAHCRHGAGRFVAAVDAGGVAGVQFHPEKSQSNGLRLLRNALGAAPA